MTNLREILSITGRPGLYRLISQGRNSLIVEDITSGNRFAALGRDKVVSLGDIAMYTQGEDLSLGEILARTYEKQGGVAIDIKGVEKSEGGLRKAFAEIVPDFDRERVHVSDIRKLFTWYNLLIGAGITEFREKEEESSEETSASTPTEEK